MCIPSLPGWFSFPSQSTSMMSQDRNTPLSTFYILAAHGGAGFHPPTFDSSLKCSLRDAVSSALTVFSDSDATPVSGNASESSALDAATALIATLEDAPDFNAGYGSNLTFDGDVECDASLMSTEENEEEIISHSTSTGSPDRTRSSSSSYSFGSVGAVRGVRNPVLLARRVLEGRWRGRGRRQQQQQQPESGEGEEEVRMAMTMMGRVPPLMLVGEGASQFAKEQGLRVVERSDSEEMVSPRARSEWRVWRERWDRCCRRSAAEEEPARASDSDLDPDLRLRGEGRHEDEEVSVLLAPRAGSGSGGDADGGPGYGDARETLRARQDTVGAVVLVGGAADDVHRQQVAAGVSSGGLLLKHSGRVGEAAVFGAGCWAERSAGGCRVACSVSGQGELIVQSLLAKTLAERIAASAAKADDDDDDDDTHDILRSVLVDEFYGKWHQRGEYQPAVGVLLITQGVDGDDDTVRLWCAFTTQSMAVAYASSRHPKPKATVLRNTAHDFSSDDDGRPPLFITTFPC